MPVFFKIRYCNSMQNGVNSIWRWFISMAPHNPYAVIWGRQGKQILALANISGAMMIQATVPYLLHGCLMKPWFVVL